MVLEQSSSSTAIKSIVKAKAAAVQRSRAMWTWTENDQEVSDGFSTEGNIWNTNTSCTKEQNLGPTAGATALFLLVSWFLPPASWLPGVFLFCPWCCRLIPSHGHHHVACMSWAFSLTSLTFSPTSLSSSSSSLVSSTSPCLSTSLRLSSE